MLPHGEARSGPAVLLLPALILLGLLALAAPARADLQVCCPAPAVLPDIRATGLEVTQGVQSALPTQGRYSGVRLVAHRTTVVRLYAGVPAGEAKLVAATLT